MPNAQTRREVPLTTAARILGVSRWTVRRMFLAGRIEGRKISPKIILIKRSQLDQIVHQELDFEDGGRYV